LIQPFIISMEKTSSKEKKIKLEMEWFLKVSITINENNNNKSHQSFIPIFNVHSKIKNDDKKFVFQIWLVAIFR
jgi:preprotein translocase subunit SecB